jgi:nucleotide-binding universal stress UspA family protein
MRHTLVPLDGSAGAEQALTLLRHLAPSVVREVTLLRVVNTQEQTFEAFRYLSRLRQRPELAHLRIRLRVECGDPVERIMDLGRDRLVVLTKARHWLPSHWLSESIAHRVIRNGAGVVLIARQARKTYDTIGAALGPSSRPASMGGVERDHVAEFLYPQGC